LSFTLPLGVILPVDEIDVRLDPAQHPFEVGREDAIAENWQREIAAKPALFDGTVVLLSEFGYDGGRLYGRCHAVGYSTFLCWRKDRVATAAHAFAHPMWRSAWRRTRSMPAASISQPDRSSRRIFRMAWSMRTATWCAR
jgi:hypothetical protein